MDSFIIVPKETIGSFSLAIKRIKMIKAICKGTETSYKTEYPHIVKLCRLCMSDVCKELTERVNFETMRFKAYTKHHEEILAGTYPAEDEYTKDLEIDITDSKYLYKRYYNLFQELQKKQLYTKACIICAATKLF